MAADASEVAETYFAALARRDLDGGGVTMFDAGVQSMVDAVAAAAG